MCVCRILRVFCRIDRVFCLFFGGIRVRVVFLGHFVFSQSDFLFVLSLGCLSYPLAILSLGVYPAMFCRIFGRFSIFLFLVFFALCRIFWVFYALSYP